MLHARLPHRQTWSPSGVSTYSYSHQVFMTHTLLLIPFNPQHTHIYTQTNRLTGLDHYHIMNFITQVHKKFLKENI